MVTDFQFHFGFIMFKFGFYDEDNNDIQDGEDCRDKEVSSPPNWLPVQEHSVLGLTESPPPHESEVTTLDICGHYMKLLNGDQVLLRLEREGAAGSLARVSEGHTDLIPDVYEGGMKVWECCRDLVAYLAEHVPLEGLHVTELGCGAALPSVFCLLRGAASVSVQDYNREVLDHLTVPNLVLAAETIYCRRSWPRLLDAVDAALAPHGTVLVAAKTFYFGVGGGTRAFEQAVLEDGRFLSEVVFSTQSGLHREILRLRRS